MTRKRIASEFSARKIEYVNNYFIDLGCKYGWSLLYCSSKFGIPVGIGVEIKKQRRALFDSY